jgi:hypothetical protein
MGRGDVPPAQLERELVVDSVWKLGQPPAERLTRLGVACGEQRPPKDQ